MKEELEMLRERYIKLLDDMRVGISQFKVMGITNKVIRQEGEVYRLMEVIDDLDYIIRRHE